MRISRSSKKRIIVTMGDPSGVGPEVTVAALASPKVRGLADFFVIGNRKILARAARIARCRMPANVLDIVSMKSGGAASLKYIDTALDLIAAGRANTLVTAPVSKAAIRKAGRPDFQGHTEYLAARFKVKDFAMMFVGKGLKAVPVTRHVPLCRVPRILSKNNIYNAIMLTHGCLEKYFRIRSPRICVCGLNPHAGESGAFGSEEAKMIAPAIKKASQSVKNIHGPISADIAFHNALAGKYDAVLAMYHDQALAPFKMLYFTSGVNLTLGLPFVRTSPDHGTAFDIAGKGIADPESMIEAIRLACRLQKC